MATTTTKKRTSTSGSGSKAATDTTNTEAETTQDRVKGAQFARGKAEKALGAAHEEAKSSADALADIERRLSSGDSSVTAEDLATARADQDRQEILVQAAEAVFKEAQATERRAIAEDVAHSVAEGAASIKMQDEQVQKARTQVETAVQQLVGAVTGRNEAISEAIARLRAAGATNSELPAHVGRELRVGMSETYINVLETEEDGDVRAEDAELILRWVLFDAANAAGLDGDKLVISPEQAHMGDQRGWPVSARRGAEAPAWAKRARRPRAVRR